MNPALLQQLLDSGQISTEVYQQLMRSLPAPSGAASVGGSNFGNVNTGWQVINNYIQAAQQAGASTAALRDGYLARLLKLCDVGVLLSDHDSDQSLKLHQVYTPLWTDWRPSTQWVDRKEGIPPPHSALEFIGAEHRRSVLLGGPGSGKSSLAHMLVAAMAAESLGRATPQLGLDMLRQGLPDDDAPAGDKEQAAQKPQAWAHGPLLPVWVVLRDLAVSPRPAGVADARWVWQYLQTKLAGWGLEAYFAPLQTHLQEHGGLIVLDGLDEVTDAAQHREHLRHAVQCFADALPRCRVLVTSRPYAYQHKAWQLEGFEVARLAPLNRAQIAHFAAAWYANKAQAQVLSATEAQACQRRLLAEVRSNPRFAKLAAEPLLLTLIAQVQTASKGELPQQRFELYQRTVNLLLTTWESTKIVKLDDGQEVQQPSLSEFLRVGPDVLRKNIERLAFEVHRDQALPTPPLEDGGTPAARDGNAELPCADISGHALRDALCRGLAADRNLKPGQLEDYLRHRAGLLAQHDDAGEVYRFPHRSFQEFLAACYACSTKATRAELIRLCCTDPGRWTEVLLLAAAKREQGGDDGAWEMADHLCPDWPPLSACSAEALQGASLAGRLMLDRALGATQADVNAHEDAKRRRFIQAQLDLLSHLTLSNATRATAGSALALLGDPRPEVMTLDGMRFAFIPAGSFTMGDESWDDSKPVHTHTLKHTFFMAEFPLSTAQWRAFVQESGHRPTSAQSLAAEGNTPAVYVTWHEARALCAWLTQRWARHLPTGWRVALPSEAEWEMASKGGHQIPRSPSLFTVERLHHAAQQRTPLQANPQAQRAYPWRGEWQARRANADNMLGRPSALGCFSTGASPYGVQDMAGQVREWTRSLFEPPYPYQAHWPQRENEDAPDNQTRVVRGSSFLDLRHFARCGYRNHARPRRRLNFLGFRVVVVFSPV